MPVLHPGQVACLQCSVTYNIDYTEDIIGTGYSLNGYFVMYLTKSDYTDTDHLVYVILIFNVEMFESAPRERVYSPSTVNSGQGRSRQGGPDS